MLASRSHSACSCSSLPLTRKKGAGVQEPKINSYTEFKEEVLPRIRSLGYNAVQIMAIQEHAYYGSFGYHVTNFFAVRAQLWGVLHCSCRMSADMTSLSALGPHDLHAAAMRSPVRASPAHRQRCGECTLHSCGVGGLAGRR